MFQEPGFRNKDQGHVFCHGSARCKGRCNSGIEPGRNKLGLPVMWSKGIESSISSPYTFLQEEGSLQPPGTAGIRRRSGCTFTGTPPCSHSHKFQKYFIQHSESHTLHTIPLALPFLATQHLEEFPEYTFSCLVSISLFKLFPQPEVPCLLLPIFAHQDSIILQFPVCLHYEAFPHTPHPQT